MGERHNHNRGGLLSGLLVRVHPAHHLHLVVPLWLIALAGVIFGLWSWHYGRLRDYNTLARPNSAAAGARSVESANGDGEIRRSINRQAQRQPVEAGDMVTEITPTTNTNGLGHCNSATGTRSTLS
jgi:hypothetical protein